MSAHLESQGQMTGEICYVTASSEHVM